VGKQCSLAYYELMMYRYTWRERADGVLSGQLRDMVARINNHSLALMQEMFDYTLCENLYDARRVNDQVALWAGRVNEFDLDMHAELEQWRTRLHASLGEKGR
jgi:hypothetical protein